MKYRVRLKGPMRPQSLYIGGNPGYGKSSLIQDMALKDIEAGRGVCVIDPTADLVNRLIHWIPRERVEDTIYFDTSTPVPVDFFSYRDPKEREILTDDLVAIFNLENAPRARPLLRKLIGTLLDANEHPQIGKKKATFLDISRFVESPKRRNKLLEFCPARKEQWAEFPKLSEFDPITTRMIPFFESPTLRTILGAATPKLNLWDVLQEKKILLVNLEDTETDLFIGALLVSKIQQSIFRRRHIRESERTPYYLYIDECQTILKYGAADFEKILTRARKYKLCLAIANQVPDDLPPQIQNKMGTIGNFILFNMDTANARFFKSRLDEYDFENLPGLVKFQAIARVNGQRFRMQTAKPLGPSPASYAKTIKKLTIDKYACPVLTLAEIIGKEDHDEPQPSGRPQDIPPHKTKARGAPATR